ncbi:MAG: polyphosphate kinase 2 family protein [Ruminococcus sp.]|nr:polyphosphate kinase 2 family protein [Ruminococcus sp.]
MSELKKFTVKGTKKIELDDFSTDEKIKKTEKEKILAKTEENRKKIAEYQDKLYSEGKESILIILQAMDAAGKDGTIKHVMSGLNPQGIDVYSFKSPNSEELSHDYMWRAIKRLPEKGKMAIFNRSYYEDVLIGKVHKLYENQKMADRCKQGDVIGRRYKEIKNFEKYIFNNSCRIIKIFLHLSKEEQKKRFLERIDLKIKNWKFSTSDIKERQYWDEYQQAYEDAINETSTKDCPWYIIPADQKFYARYLVSEAILDVMKKIDPKYPTLPEEERRHLIEDKELLLSENN